MKTDEVSEEIIDYKITPSTNNNIANLKIWKPDYSSKKWKLLENHNKVSKQKHLIGMSQINNEFFGFGLSTTNLKKGGSTMSADEFVTQKELNHLEEKVDLKLEVIQTKIDAEFRVINTKIDNLPTVFGKMLLENEKEHETKRKETNRYIWGTIVLGAIGLIVSIVGFFF